MTKLEEAQKRYADHLASKPEHRPVADMTTAEYANYSKAFSDWDRKESMLQIDIFKLERAKSYGKGDDWALERFVPRACA